MKNFFLICLISSFYFNFSVLYAQQIEPVTGQKYLDQGRFDSIFRENYPGNIPPTYFVFTFDPSMSILTLAGEVIRGYKEIRKFDKNTVLYLIYPNKGVVSNEKGDEEKYFKEQFHIDKEKDKNVFFIQNEDLYTMLNVYTIMTKWFYIYQHKLIGGATAVKLNSMGDQGYNFPRDIVNVGQPKKIKVSSSGVRLSIYRDILRPYVPGKIFYITDMNNNLHILNTTTGVIEESMNKNQYNPVDFYCKYMAVTPSDCDIAKADNFATEYNRDNAYFTAATYVGKYIYISTEAEVNVPWERTMYAGHYLTYQDELGKKVKFKEAFFVDTYPVVLKLDTSLTLLDAFYLNTRSYPKKNSYPKANKKVYYGASDRGLYINDTIAIFENNVQVEPDEKIPNVSKNAFSQFKIGEKQHFNFNKELPVKYFDGYENYTLNHTRSYYFQLNNNIYVNVGNGGYIHRLNGDYGTYKLKGLGMPLIKEIIPKYNEDTIRFTINYASLAANSLYDKYAAVLYLYQDIPTLEILKEGKTGNLVTVQVTPLNKLEGFKEFEIENKKEIYTNNGDGMCINDNKIYLMRFINGEYILYEYPIVLNKQ